MAFKSTSRNSYRLNNRNGGGNLSGTVAFAKFGGGNLSGSTAF